MATKVAIQDLEPNDRRRAPNMFMRYPLPAQFSAMAVSPEVPLHVGRRQTVQRRHARAIHQGRTAARRRGAPGLLTA
ncbi:MAG: hypothetical protein DWQ35_10995 [Planctomycetota bacterium]|nr:MAG: hypothetical protein DWQ35_10995 [Planctomycetota bacterium]REK30570.1 MAG: hypothetical protein DWQ42_01625 [Planctomycetota bacterium]REK45994.1 MAG: hypothetical protein DWQ46_07455 [Planctomycetota bacterium]